MSSTDSAAGISLKETIPGWPHLTWITSYAGADKLSPDPARAVLDGVRERDDAVVITARERERKFTAAVSIADTALRRVIVTSLTPAIGTTLNDLADVEIVATR